jgi:hypothetical protein
MEQYPVMFSGMHWSHTYSPASLSWFKSFLGKDFLQSLHSQVSSFGLLFWSIGFFPSLDRIGEKKGEGKNKKRKSQINTRGPYGRPSFVKEIDLLSPRNTQESYH